MSDRIEGEIVLDNKQFTSATKESAAAASDLGKRFESVAQFMSRETRAAFDQITKGLKGVEQSFKTSTDGINKHIKSINFEKALSQIESFGSKSRTLFANAIGVGAGFEGEINKIGSITGASRAQLDQYGESIRKMSGELNLAARPAETAAIAYEAFSSNFDDINSASTIAANSLKLIADGAAKSSEATKLLTGALNAYGETADQANKFTDILFQTQNFGATTIAELSNSLGLVTSTAAAAGVPFEELAAAMATTTIKGINTSSSVEGLRGLLIKLIDPTKESIEAQKKYGLEINATTLKQKGLLQLLKEVRAAVGADQQAFNDIAGTAQAFTVALALTDEGASQFTRNLERMRGSAGAADKAVAKISEGLDYSKRQFKAALENLEIGATKSILPIATAIVKAGASILYVMDKTPGPIKTAVLVMTGLAGAIGLAAGAVGGLRIALAATGIEFATLVTKASLLTGAMEFYLTGSVNQAFRALSGTIAQAGNAAKAAAAGGFANLASAVRGLPAAFTGFGGTLAGALAGFAALGVGVGFVISKYVDLSNEIADADLALQKSERGFAGLGRQVTEISSDTARTVDAKTLDEINVKPEDIRNRIAIERGNLYKLEPEEKAKKLKEIDELIAKEQELIDIQKKRQEAPVREQEDKEAQQAASQRFRDALQEIDLDKASHKDKIDRLEMLRVQFRLNSQEERALNRAIAKEQEAEAKNQSTYLKNLHKDRLAQHVQDVENSKEATKTKILQLRELIKAYNLVGAERRRIEDKIYAYEQQIEKKRQQDEAKRKKRLEQLNERREERTRDSADSTIKESERATREDVRLQETGLDTSAEQAREIQKRLKAEKDKVDSRARSDIAKETDPDGRAEITRKATADKLELEKAAAEEIRNLQRDQGERSLKDQSDRVNREIALSTRKVEALKSQIEAGKANDKIIEAAILDRLDLMTQEIKLQAQLAEARTNDPREAAQIEEEAAGKIADAQRAAKKEIEETNKAIEEQKAKSKAKSKEFSGGILSLDQFFEQNHQFGEDKPIERKPSGALNRLDFEIKDATRKSIYDSQPRTKEELKGQIKKSDANLPPVQKVDIEGVIILKSETGEVLGQTKDLSINGKKYHRQARTVGD